MCLRVSLGVVAACAVYDESLLTSGPDGLAAGGTAGHPGSGGASADDGGGGQAGDVSIDSDSGEPVDAANASGGTAGTDVGGGGSRQPTGGGGAAGSGPELGGNGGSVDASAGGSGSAGAGGTSASSGAGGSGQGGTGMREAGVMIDAPADSPDTSPPLNGCAGRAIRFDGSVSYATMKQIPTDDFTIEAWIRTSTAHTANAAYLGLGLFWADVMGTANDYGVSIVNQNIAFVVGNPDTTLTCNTAVTNGTWMHVAVTRQKSTGSMIIYVNGAVDKTVVGPNTGSLSAPSALLIGGNTLNQNYYVGDIDELRVWTVVRSQPQIAAAMHTKLVGNETGLNEYYRFDQTAGDTISDLSTNKASKSNAAITGTPQFVLSDAPLLCP